MEGDLPASNQQVKSPLQPEIKTPEADPYAYQSCHKGSGVLLLHTDTYTLNDYMLARGSFIYIGVGTFNSEGFMVETINKFWPMLLSSTGL